jgi:hypothetical protein
LTKPFYINTRMVSTKIYLKSQLILGFFVRAPPPEPSPGAFGEILRAPLEQIRALQQTAFPAVVGGELPPPQFAATTQRAVPDGRPGENGKQKL